MAPGYNADESMPPLFHLYWLRENGCDAGTLIHPDQVEAPIRDRVCELARASSNRILTLHLPFFNRRQWKRRRETLSRLKLYRQGDAILCDLSKSQKLREKAAGLALADPVWAAAPEESDPDYFAVWQRVSLSLQGSLRRLICWQRFRDAERYEDRPAAYPFLVYEATRLCYGRPRTEFTYDLSDYPDCSSTLASAWKLIGRSLQGILAKVEQRLTEAGKPALARRYAPIWYQDIIREVRKRPNACVRLLAHESALINSIIQMGIARNVESVSHFTKTAERSLRKVGGRLEGEDMRDLALFALDEATRVLASELSRGGEHILRGGISKYSHLLAARSPGLRISS